MKLNIVRLINLAVVLSIVANVGAQTNSNYQKNIDEWDKNRVSNLKATNGWLNLAGLYWLSPGENSFGAGAQNQIQFPKNTIAETAGTFTLTGNTVTLKTTEQAAVKKNGVPVKELVVVNTDSSQSTVFTSGSLQWTIIKRGIKTGIRLRDLNSENITAFKGIERYKADTNWIIKAKLQTDNHPNQILIKNIIGQTSEQASPGKLSFKYNGNDYTLDALEEGDDLFIIFADSTSGLSTYPSGRFLTVNKPGPDGIVLLDFNKAYNPPCAFTPYATCPLPPKQNFLPFAVTAGEKKYH